MRTKAEKKEYDRIWKNLKTQKGRDISGAIHSLSKEVDKKKRARLEKDPAKFLRFFWPDDYCNKFTADQLIRINQIVELMTNGGVQARAEPRGDGKTIICEGLLVWAIVKNLIRFVVLVKANTEQAREMLDNIMTKICCDKFSEWYPEISYPFIEVGAVKQKIAGQNYDGASTELEFSRDKICLANIPGCASSGIIVKGYGMDKPIRGVREGSQRPDFFIIDDPETAESAVSAGEIKKRSERIDKEVSKLGGPSRNISGVLLTTIQAKGSVSDIYTDIKQKPAWGGVRNAALKSWPKNMNLWDEYMQKRKDGQIEGDRETVEANKFYKANRKQMDEGCELSNLNVYDKKREISAIQGCFNFIADYGKEAFLTEYQNEPPAEVAEEGFELTSTTIQKRCNGIKQRLIPDGYTHLTAGIDVGGRLAYWVVKAWKDEFISHVVDYGVTPIHSPIGNLRDEIYAKELEEAIYLALSIWHDEHMNNYCYSSGEVRPLDCVAIDCGYQTNAIYNFIRDMRSRAYIPIKGYGTASLNKIYRVPRGQSETVYVGRQWHKTFHKYNHLKLWLYHCDDDFYKFKVQQGFVLQPDTPGATTLYGDTPFDHKTYARSIVSEKRIEEFKPGKGLVVEYRVKDQNQNHYLDATKYARVAAAVCGVREAKQIEYKPEPKRERFRRKSTASKVRINTSY